MIGSARGVSVPLGYGWGTKTGRQKRIEAVIHRRRTRSANSKGPQGKPKAKHVPVDDHLPNVHWHCSQLERIGLRKVRKDGRVTLRPIESCTIINRNVIYSVFGELPVAQRRAVRLGIAA